MLFHRRFLVVAIGTALYWSSAVMLLTVTLPPGVVCAAEDVDGAVTAEEEQPQQEEQPQPPPAEEEEEEEEDDVAVATEETTTAEASAEETITASDGDKEGDPKEEEESAESSTEADEEEQEQDASEETEVVETDTSEEEEESAETDEEQEQDATEETEVVETPTEQQDVEKEAPPPPPVVQEIPTTTIRGRLQYPDKSPFNYTTQVVLNHGEWSTYCRLLDGVAGAGAGCDFSLHQVPAGVHQLDVLSTTHHFATVKIQVTPTAATQEEQVKCLEYPFPGASKNAVPHPLQLTAYATMDYFEVRRGFSIWMILKNPMVLMMAFSVGIMYFMPKMMEGLDPEEKARMKQQMEMQQDPSKMLNSLWEGFSAGEDETSAAAAAAKKKPIKSASGNPKK